MSTPASSRSARIDFLRGVAILSVLLLHFSLTYKLTDSPLSSFLPTAWVRAAIVNGNYGVTIFFVISGFLITSNNLQRYGGLGKVRLGQFYTFRFARIVPPLALALGIIVTLGLVGRPSFINSTHGQTMAASFFLPAVLSVLTFWHNVLMQKYGYFNYCLNIYWSLSVEEVFYLVFPIACVMLRRNFLIITMCAAAIVVGPIYRSVHVGDEIYFMYGYWACFDAIAFGCLAAIIYPRLRIDRRAGAFLRWVSGIGLTAVYLRGIDGHEVFGFSLIALCTAGLLANAFDVGDERQRYLPSRFVRWFGRHSYELYLFHIVVLGCIRDSLPKSAVAPAYKLPLFALFLCLSWLTAAIAARYFADPVNAMIRKLGAVNAG